MRALTGLPDIRLTEETDDPDARPDLAVVEVLHDDDVPWDDLLELAGHLVVLSDDLSPSWVGECLRAGASAVLARTAPEEELLAALHAAAAGLVAVHREEADAMLSSARRPAPAGLAPVESLTPREREVLAMLAEGCSNKQIAARLDISEHTAKFHVASILGKLGAASRTEAVTAAIRLGLLMV
ncbi:MAG TPA: response regulator transcription factor [Bacteroidota bacterium]